MNSWRRRFREPLRFTCAGRCRCKRACFIMEDKKLISGEWASGEPSHAQLLFTPWAHKIHHASATAHASHITAFSSTRCWMCQYGIIHGSSPHPLGDYAKSSNMRHPPKMLLLEVFTYNHHNIKKNIHEDRRSVLMIISSFSGTVIHSYSVCVWWCNGGPLWRSSLWVESDSHAYSV